MKTSQQNHRCMCIIISIVLLMAIPPKILSEAIYTGEPLAEALYDLARCGVPIAHELNSASGLGRTVVYKLNDGRLIALTSQAESIGGPVGIREIRVSDSPDDTISRKIHRISRVDLHCK